MQMIVPLSMVPGSECVQKGDLMMSVFPGSCGSWKVEGRCR